MPVRVVGAGKERREGSLDRFGNILDGLEVLTRQHALRIHKISMHLRG